LIPAEVPAAQRTQFDEEEAASVEEARPAAQEMHAACAGTVA
jgi:hypothetical protein